MATVKAGSPALRKAMRRFPDLRLVGSGVNAHAVVCFANGNPVRLGDGRRLTIPCSPRDDDRSAQQLVRRLESLGISPR